MDRLSDVEVFVRVVEHRSFSKAAEALGISRSYASRMVAGLEQRLGVRLLHRTTRAVAVTPSGQSFYEDALPHLEGISIAEARAREEARAPSGTLKVSLPLAFGVRWLVNPLLRFQEQHPDIQLAASFSDQKVDLIGGGLDLAVRGGDVAAPHLVARGLWRFDVLVVASPAWVARHGMPRHPTDLASVPCLLYSGSPQANTWTLSSGEERVVIKVGGPAAFDSALALVEAAITGRGAIYLPEWCLVDALADGRLVRLLPGWANGPIRFWAVRPERRHVPSRVVAFQDFLLNLPDPWR